MSPWQRAAPPLLSKEKILICRYRGWSEAWAVSIHGLGPEGAKEGLHMSLGQWRLQLSLLGLYLPHLSPCQQHIPYLRCPDGREGPGKSQRC